MLILPVTGVPNPFADMRTVLVAGGRYYRDKEIVFNVLEEHLFLNPFGHLMHGACGWNADKHDSDPDKLRGVDRWAHEWATRHKLHIITVPARWTTKYHHGGPFRNREMKARLRLDLGDTALLFPGGSGTRDMYRVLSGHIPLIRILLDGSREEKGVGNV